MSYSDKQNKAVPQLLRIDYNKGSLFRGRFKDQQSSARVGNRNQI